jgi:hypothetical protein
LAISEGLQDNVTWKVRVYTKDGNMQELLATNRRLQSDMLRMDIFDPTGKLNKDDVEFVVVFDRLGQTAYNSVGLSQPVKDLKKFNPVDFQDFFKINPTSVKEISNGSGDFLKLSEEYGQAFKVEGGQELLGKVIRRYGQEFAACNFNVTDQRIKEIMKRDSEFQALVNLINKGWGFYLTMPFIGVHQTLLVGGLVKLVQLPSIFEDKIDLPGYSTYKPNAADVAEMFEIGMQIYGGNQSAPTKEAIFTPQSEHALPGKVKALIKGTSCENSNTYEEYNACVLEYNKAIK